MQSGNPPMEKWKHRMGSHIKMEIKEYLLVRSINKEKIKKKDLPKVLDFASLVMQ